MQDVIIRNPLALNDDALTDDVGIVQRKCLVCSLDSVCGACDFIALGKEQYFASGYTKSDLKLMHPNLEI